MAGIVNKAYYYSFKIFLRFWLAKMSPPGILAAAAFGDLTELFPVN